MNLHEYQAKQLFAEFGLPVPEVSHVIQHKKLSKLQAVLVQPRKLLSVKYTLVVAVKRAA